PEGFVQGRAGPEGHAGRRSPADVIVPVREDRHRRPRAATSGAFLLPPGREPVAGGRKRAGRGFTRTPRRVVSFASPQAGREMYTLYYAPGAASMVVHWLLIEFGAKHELRRLDLDAKDQKRPEYLALNPRGVVPTLLVHGEPLTESAALVMHLADAHPSFGMAPEPGSVERGRYYQWILFLANTVMPAFRTWWYPHEVPGGPEAAKADAERRIHEAWDLLE